MATMPPEQERTDEYYEARSMLTAAKRKEEKARSDLAEARSLHAREDNLISRARRMAAEASTKNEEARRKAGDTQRQGEEASRKGLTRIRLDTQAHQWEAKVRRSASDIRRWEDEVGRKERNLRVVAKEVRERTQVATERAKESHSWEQKLKLLALMPRRSKASDEFALEAEADPVEKLEPEAEPSPEAEPEQMSITARATEALKRTLDDMERGPDQCLRLAVDVEGVPTLHLDVAKQGDVVVNHDGTSVLLIDSPILEALTGSTLDISESSDGTQIILSG